MTTKASKKAVKKDNGLFHLLVELTGLDRDTVETELSAMMKKLDIDSDNLTTADMRKIMAEYLEELHSEFMSRLPNVDLAAAEEAILMGEAEA